MDLPDENEGHQILAATLTVTIVALITMVARLYVRVRMIKNMGWDDYTMIFAMLLCIAGQIIIIPEVRMGAGRHIQYIDPLDFQKAFKLNFITQPIYLIAICIVKESVGFFLLRLAVIPIYRKIIIGIMVFMGLYTFGCFLTVVLQCTNLAVQWDPNAKGTCWGPSTLKGLSYTNVALNIVTDLLFAIIIPIPMLWNVQMNRRQKMSIIAILGLGVFATVAALIKISAIPSYGKTGDWLWDSKYLTIFTVVESNVGIIAGNLPCLKPLFRSVLGSTYGRGTRKTTPKYLSRPYGAGTGHHHSVNNYNSLASSRTQEGQDSYGTKEAHMLTTIDVKKTKSESVHSLQDRPSSKNSEEWLNENSYGRLGGITKTTEVNVTESNGGKSHDDEMRPERMEAHHIV
ncbi:hypothetical protein B0J11DRAFT_291617 [Dendryphion nanum]|uniref:Rhodopsin domain-containing protein n=1 Tax=Dendryphion nanum TaxID=256645 RepID=A0A9P9IPZ1_9PLEO|nr:hypothetical protein B0J11DRAFT_291617 [Dendryphion nanum]